MADPHSSLDHGPSIRPVEGGIRVIYKGSGKRQAEARA
jgi:hypothetical protein